jgi:hypothetical protein
VAAALTLRASRQAARQPWCPRWIDANHVFTSRRANQNEPVPLGDSSRGIVGTSRYYGQFGDGGLDLHISQQQLESSRAKTSALVLARKDVIANQGLVLVGSHIVKEDLTQELGSAGSNALAVSSRRPANSTGDFDFLISEGCALVIICGYEFPPTSPRS